MAIMMVAAYTNEHDYMHNLAVNYKNKKDNIAIISYNHLQQCSYMSYITVIYSTIYIPYIGKQ